MLFCWAYVAPELRPEEGGKLLGNRGELGIPSAAPELITAGDAITPACLGVCQHWQ